MNSQTNQESSDYRGLRDSPTESTTNRKYSTVLTQQVCPSKEQAIIFPAINEAKLEDYLIPLGKIIEPKNILYSSRLSNNRMCMYLSSKIIVEKFMIEHGGTIQMNNTTIQARRYVTPSERLILSNVCPTIPNDILIKELENIGLTLLSPMTSLRISATLPEFSHILSFRRQVFISPTNETIPESVLIQFDETTYRIFLFNDDTTCYNCKQTGHKAANCTNAITKRKTTNDIHAQNTPQPKTQTSSVALSPSTSKDNTTSIITNTDPQTATTSNKSLSPSSNTPKHDSNNSESSSEPQIYIQPARGTTTLSSIKRNIDEIITPPDPDEDNTPQFKKPSNNSPNPKKKNTTYNHPLNPLENFINQQNPPMILDFNQITDLLENIKGTPDPINIVKNYTGNYILLIDMLTKIYPHIQERAIKTRSTKLRKNLMKYLQIQTQSEGTTDSESDYSQK